MDWTTLGTCLTAIGAVLVAVQIRASNRIARADFLLRLEGEFVTHYLETYQKLIDGASWAPSGCGPATPAEVAQLEHYLDFFASLHILLYERLISIDSIDKMFAYRFFVAIHNPHIHRVIEPKRQYWEQLLTLYNKWIAFRERNKQPIPQRDHSLPLQPAPLATMAASTAIAETPRQ